MTYEVSGANLGIANGITYTLQSTVAEIFPTSYRYVLVSVWLKPATDDIGAQFSNGGQSGFSVQTLGPQYPNILSSFPEYTNGMISVTVRTAGVIDNGEVNFNASPLPGMVHHLLVSLDSVGQIVQCALDDTVLSVFRSTWTGSGLMEAFSDPSNIKGYRLGGGDAIYCFGDCYAAHTDTFIDLTVTANRRKFINADLTPVDIGLDGSGPIGRSPEIWLSIRTPENTSELLTNRGTGGSDFVPLWDQTPLYCFGPHRSAYVINPVYIGTGQVFSATGQTFSNRHPLE